MEGSPDRGAGPLEPLAAASPRSPSAAAGAGQPPGFGAETQAEVRRDVRVHRPLPNLPPPSCGHGG